MCVAYTPPARPAAAASATSSSRAANIAGAYTSPVLIPPPPSSSACSMSRTIFRTSSGVAARDASPVTAARIVRCPTSIRELTAGRASSSAAR